MANAQWHCALNGQQQGPFTIDQLREMAGRGALPAETLVWTDGMTDWQPLRATPLAGLLAGGAAMAPPMQTMAAPSLATAMPMGGPAPTNVGFVDAIKICLGKYIDFTGRASRPEFWWFMLFGVIVSLLTGWIDYVGILVSLALLLPNIAVGVRRLHDTDRSGWWYLLALIPLVGFIVLIVFWCQPGTQGRNRFG